LLAGHEREDCPHRLVGELHRVVRGSHFCFKLLLVVGEKTIDRMVIISSRQSTSIQTHSGIDSTGLVWEAFASKTTDLCLPLLSVYRSTGPTRASRLSNTHRRDCSK
jgi:hypothetical protein